MGVGQSLFCQACALHIANRKCRGGVELLRRVVLRALSTMFLFAGSLCVLAGQPEHDVPCVNTGTSCIALNPNVTPATIAKTICLRGYTGTVRPGPDVTAELKNELIGEAGLPADDGRKMVLDHIIPLELGGHPNHKSNLQLQDRSESRQKDRIEKKLNCLVCSGQVKLDDARSAIAMDWGAAYAQFEHVTCQQRKREKRLEDD